MRREPTGVAEPGALGAGEAREREREGVGRVVERALDVLVDVRQARRGEGVRRRRAGGERIGELRLELVPGVSELKMGGASPSTAWRPQDSSMSSA